MTVIVVSEPTPVFVPSSSSGAPGSQGAPGGNVMSVGLFSALGGIAVPAGTTLIQTSGHGVEGRGHGLYIEDTSLTDADVAAHSRAMKKTANNRYFRLSLNQQIRLWHFGAAGAPTNDSAGMLAAFAYLEKYAGNVSTYHMATQGVYIAAQDHFYFGGQTFERLNKVDVYGDNSGLLGDPASTLEWDDGTPGFIIQAYNTDGQTGDASSPLHKAGDGTALIGLNLVSRYATSLSESESHAVQLRGRGTVQRCNALNWAGNMVHIAADAGDATIEGNANLWVVDTVTATNCRNTLWVQAGNVNAGMSRKVVGISNRQGNIVEQSFLGNYHGQSFNELCGAVPGAIPTWCAYSGRIFAVKWGQGTWCSTNAPPTSDTSNTGWLFLGAGAANSTVNRPTWVSGMTWRAGGGILSTCINTPCVFDTTYSESGGPPSQAAQAVHIRDATEAAGIYGIDGLGNPVVTGAAGGELRMSSGHMAITAGHLNVRGDGGGTVATLGRDTGTLDCIVNLQSGSANCWVYFDSYNAGFSREGTIVTFNGGMKVQGKTVLRLGTASADIMQVAAGAVIPMTDNAIDLGSASNRWGVVYAGTGTINTSDKRLKTGIARVGDTALDAWADVEWQQFKFKEAVRSKGREAARVHTGLVAQQVQQAFERHKLDGFALGLLCHDEWDDEHEPVFVEQEYWHEQTLEPEPGSAEPRIVREKRTRMVQQLDGKGKPKTRLSRKAGDVFGVRYEEALAMEAALMRRTVERLEQRVRALEKAAG